jgi:hypothetical protein
MRLLMALAAFFLLSLMTISCGDKGVPPSPRPATKLEIISGNGQIPKAGAFLPDSLMVRVTTDMGEPIPDVQVVYEQTTPIDGGRFTWPTPRTSDADGYVKNKYYADTVVGIDTIRVTASDIEDSVVCFIVTVIPNDPDTIIIESGDGQEGYSGGTLSEPCVVKVTDKYDNPVPDLRTRFVVYGECLVITDSTAAADTAYTRTAENGMAQAYWIMASVGSPSYTYMWVYMMVDDQPADSVRFSAKINP